MKRVFVLALLALVAFTAPSVSAVAAKDKFVGHDLLNSDSGAPKIMVFRLGSVGGQPHMELSSMESEGDEDESHQAPSATKAASQDEGEEEEHEIHALHEALHPVMPPFFSIIDKLIDSQMNNFFHFQKHHPTHGPRKFLRGQSHDDPFQLGFPHPAFPFGHHGPVARIRFMLNGPRLTLQPLNHFNPPMGQNVPPLYLKPHESATSMHICYEDAQEHCKDAHDSKQFVQVMACLKANEHNLSEGCHDTMKFTPSFECGHDVNTNCPDAHDKAGITACLIKFKDHLSASCKGAIDHVSDGKAEGESATGATGTAGAEKSPIVVKITKKSVAEHEQTIEKPKTVNKDEAKPAAAAADVKETTKAVVSKDASTAIATATATTLEQLVVPQAADSSLIAQSTAYAHNVFHSHSSVPLILLGVLLVVVSLVIGGLVCRARQEPSTNKAWRSNYGDRQSKAPGLADDILNSEVEQSVFAVEYDD